MRKTREEKAITLIALIITIVVLLILAVVAINAVTGDGIIQHATNAKTEYEKAQDEENSMLSYYEKYLESQGASDIWDGKTSKKPEIKDGNWYIYNCSEFKFFADFVNGTLTEKEGIEEITGDTTVYLMSNLDLGARQTDGKLTTGTAWTPIGTSSTASFIGTFEGNNHYIKGIYVNDEDGFAGIFGYSTNIIKNLTVKDSYVEAYGRCVGGIVGKGENVINCHNVNTTVKQTNEYKVAGIVGQAASVENCTNTGNIIGNGVFDVITEAGGIVGLLANNGYIYNCKNSGTIIGIGHCVGGIAGSINSNSDTNNESEKIGIKGCINNGFINGSYSIGGIVGAIASSNDEFNNCKIIDSYNTGKISGESNIGGISGTLAGINGGGKIRGCYNIGKIDGNENCGSIIGSDASKGRNNTIEKCYYLEETRDLAIGNISDLSTLELNIELMNEEQMNTKTFAEKLNLATNTGVWVGIDGKYPKLSWE